MKISHKKIIKIAFISIFMCLTFLAYATNQYLKSCNSPIKQTSMTLKNYSQIIAVFELECSKLPTTLSDLVTGPSDCPIFPKKGMFNKAPLPKDGWNQNFDYKKTSKGYIIKSSGPDKTFNTADDIITEYNEKDSSLNFLRKRKLLC